MLLVCLRFAAGRPVMQAAVVAYLLATLAQMTNDEPQRPDALVSLCGTSLFPAFSRGPTFADSNSAFGVPVLMKRIEVLGCLMSKTTPVCSETRMQKTIIGPPAINGPIRTNLA
jgi:hypothetical protein